MIAEQTLTLTKHLCRGWAGRREFGSLGIAAPDRESAAAEYARAVMKAHWVAVDRVLVSGVEISVEVVCEVKILRDGREVSFR